MPFSLDSSADCHLDRYFNHLPRPHFDDYCWSVLLYYTTRCFISASAVAAVHHQIFNYSARDGEEAEMGETATTKREKLMEK